MLFTIRRRSQVSLFLARVRRICTLDRRVNEYKNVHLPFSGVRTSPFPNPRRPLVSVSSCSGRIRKLLPQVRVCVFRLVSMVRIWFTRSLGRLNFFDLLLRHNALVGGHPGPRKKADEHSYTR